VKNALLIDGCGFWSSQVLGPNDLTGVAVVDNLLTGTLRNTAEMDDNRLRVTWCDPERFVPDAPGQRNPPLRLARFTGLMPAAKLPRLSGPHRGLGHRQAWRSHVDDTRGALERNSYLHGLSFYERANTGGDREVPVLDGPKSVAAKVSGPRGTFAPRLPQDPAYCCPDLTRCNAKLPGSAPRVAFKKAISRTIEWFRHDIARWAVPPAPAGLRL
jgi:hypothetical protein